MEEGNFELKKGIFSRAKIPLSIEGDTKKCQIVEIVDQTQTYTEKNTY